MSSESQMPESQRGPQNARREFLRLFGRLGALGALAAIAAALACKARDKQACSNDGICASCVAFNRCGLPQAATARQADRKANP